MEGFLLTIAVCFVWFISVFLGIVLIAENRKNSYGIVLFFLVKSLLLLVYYLHYSGYLIHSTLSLRIAGIFAYPALGLTFYYLVKQVTKTKITKNDRVFTLLVFLVITLAITQFEKVVTYERQLMLSSILLAAVMMRAIYILHKRSGKQISDVEKSYYTSVAFITIVLVAINVVDLFWNTIGELQLFYILIVVLLADNVLSFFYVFYKYHSFVHQVNMNIANEAQERRYTFSEEYLLVNREFLNPDLTIQQLAERMNTDRAGILADFNQSAEHFNEFVAKARIEEFKRLVAEESNAEKMHITILAYRSGFNSRSTFNRTFKKYEKVTPEEYIKCKT